jgi:hypothetical protein
MNDELVTKIRKTKRKNSPSLSRRFRPPCRVSGRIDVDTFD